MDALKPKVQTILSQGFSEASLKQVPWLPLRYSASTEEDRAPSIPYSLIKFLCNFCQKIQIYQLAYLWLIINLLRILFYRFQLTKYKVWFQHWICQLCIHTHSHWVLQVLHTQDYRISCWVHLPLWNLTDQNRQSWESQVTNSYRVSHTLKYLKMRFSGFKSLCTMFLLCIATKADKMFLMITAASLSQYYP